MHKKVLLACPTADVKAYCLEPYIQALKKLTYPNVDILLADNSATDSYSKKIQALNIPCIRTACLPSIPERVINSRNILRQRALEEDYDYFFSLEQDVIPPANIIELLLEPEEDIVSGVTPHLLLKNGKASEIALLGLDDKNNPGKYLFFDYKDALRYKSGIVPVDYAAMGCLLISRKILEKITFRWEPRPDTQGETDVHWDDICFCNDIKKLGFHIHANVAAKCDHLYHGGYSATLGNTQHITKTKRSL